MPIDVLVAGERRMANSLRAKKRRPVPPPILAPVISDVQAASVTSAGATISWTLSQYATGYVQYGTTTSYGYETIHEQSFIYNSHSQNITGLDPSTTYHYRVRSTNAQGLESISSDYTFVTSAGAPIAEEYGIYGPAIDMDALNNSQVGGIYNDGKVAYRFTAEQASALTAINVYVITQNGGVPQSGYAAGNCGTMRVTVQGDDAGYPDGVIKAQAVDMAMNFQKTAGLSVEFLTPYTPSVGEKLHMVFHNVDASPSVNFWSMDGTYYFGDAKTPFQPKFADEDWANERLYQGVWSDDRDVTDGATTPIMDITYANGQHQGHGYMERWGGEPYQIRANGTERFREVFTPTSEQVVDGVFVRIARTSGSSSLVVRLETSAGTEIETVNVSYASLPVRTRANEEIGGSTALGFTWTWVPFLAYRTLAAGTTYNLVFSTNTGTEYWIWAPRRGPSWGYTAATYFNDGHGQWYNGSVWAAIRSQSGTPVAIADVPFYFRTATTLQQYIDDAATSSTLDLTGYTFLSGATVNKALTIVGGTINVPAGQKGLTITANNVTVNGMTINGSQHASYSANENGIHISATQGSPISGLVIKDCVIDNFGANGIYARNVTAPQLGTVGQGNTISNCTYAGIMLLSSIGGSVRDNVISHIGEANDPSLSDNCYGVAVSTTPGEPVSSDVLVDGNTVSYAGFRWEAFDTHAGLRITFSNNTISRARRNFAIMGDSSNRYATDIVITGNVMSDPYDDYPPGVRKDVSTVLLLNVVGIDITNNTSTGFNAYNPGSAPVYDYLGLSTDVVQSGNSLS